jgi:hypothetical protein
MRINSSGKLLVGSSSDYAENVQAAFYGASNGGIALASGTSGLSRLMFADATSGNAGAFVGSIIYAHSDNSLRFNVNGGIERMRILSNGVLCIGRTTETVDFNNFGTSIGSVLSHSRAVTAASPSVAFYGAQGYAQVMGDGDLENTHGRYGSLSDQTLKENIVDANSQWNDIKNIKIRNFNFKESTGFATHKQIGVIAQELETVCPNLVDENDQGIKAVASSVLYMKAVKALQEAQARIETLETKVAALEAA